MTPQLLSMKVANIHTTSITSSSRVYIAYVRNRYSDKAKSCKALLSMYINEFRGCQKLILFAFS